MEKIPDEVRKQILIEPRRMNYDAHEAPIFEKGAEFGYSLASKALPDANNRLKLKDAVNVEFRLKIEKLEVELSDANKEIADLKRQLEKYETNRYDKDEDDYDPDKDRDDPRNNQTFGGRY